MIDPPPIQTVTLTWDEYRSMFGHLANDPCDLVGKTLAPPPMFNFGFSYFINNVEVTRDKVSAQYTPVMRPEL